MGNRCRFGRGAILAVLPAFFGILGWISVGNAADNVRSGCIDCHQVKPGSAGGGRPGSTVGKPGGASPHAAAPSAGAAAAGKGTAPAAPPGATSPPPATTKGR